MRVIVQVAIDKEGEGLWAVERVWSMEVEFRIDNECVGVNLLVGNFWREIHPRVGDTVDIGVSNGRGWLELDVKVVIDFHRIGAFGADILDDQSSKERRRVFLIDGKQDFGGHVV